MTRLLLTTAAFALLVTASPVVAQRAPGIVGDRAPAWGIEQWINLPQGRQTLDVGDFEGKVVYLYGFQSWCPGCHSRGFPTLRELIGHYEDDDDVAFVAVQTVFEGYATNTAQKAWETARRYDLEIPVGHDGAAGKRSVLMRRYRTGGTPWAIIIDRQGVVRWNGFHISAADARRRIDRLLAERPASPPRIRTLPASRGGQDLVGTEFAKLEFDSLLEPASGVPDPATPRATLYRWWTDGCPYCRVSLPAVEALRKRYGPDGLRVVAVYHPKPPREVDDREVRDAARQLGYEGLIAVDHDWSRLDKAYLSSGRRKATSVTFLVDDRGVTKFVQPGPVFFPSDDPRFAQENADYRLLRDAIEVLLEGKS